MKLVRLISVALHELLIGILNCCLVCSSCCLYAEMYRYFYYFYPIKNNSQSAHRQSLIREGFIK